MLTTTQAAAFLGVSVRRVQKLIADGRLPATRFGGAWEVQLADLRAFAATPRRAGRPVGWRKHPAAPAP